MTFATTYALILPAITVETGNTGAVGGMYLEEEHTGVAGGIYLEEDALAPEGVSISADLAGSHADDGATGDVVTDAAVPDGDSNEEDTMGAPAETDEAAPIEGTLNAQGDDYSVTLTYDAAAGIPGGAALTVSEIEQDS